MSMYFVSVKHNMVGYLCDGLDGIAPAMNELKLSYPYVSDFQAKSFLEVSRIDQFKPYLKDLEKYEK